MNVTYERRKAEGTCVRCGKRPSEGGVRCRVCKEEQKKAWQENVYARKLYNNKQRQKYWQARNAGVCVRCRKADVFPGMTMCGPCAEKERTKKKEKRRE